MEQTTSQAPQEARCGWCSQMSFARLWGLLVVMVHRNDSLTAPRLVPFQALNVDQYALEFRDGECRVSVVELDGDLVGEFLPRALALFESANNVVERGSAPKVLLLQSKLLTTFEAISSQ